MSEALLPGFEAVGKARYEALPAPCVSARASPRARAERQLCWPKSKTRPATVRLEILNLLFGEGKVLRDDARLTR